MKRASILRWLICLIFCATALSAGSLARADGLEIHFLDVARNDGILIRCDGESAFLDSGTYKWGAPCADYMKNVGVTSLKYYIGTHAHLDHVGGAPAILAALPTGAVLAPHNRVEDLIEDCARTAAEKEAVSAVPYQLLRAGERVNVGSATLTCLGPMTVSKASYTSTAENANSLVLMLTYGETRILLTGDATGTSLKAIEAANPGCLRADVLKNAHHNGRTRDELLSVIRPRYTVFSTSSSNMPSRDIISSLSEMGSRVLVTTASHSGNIVMTSDGQSISVQTQYAPTSLTLEQSALSVYEGKSASLKAVMKPSKRFKALTWTSDDPSIAKVDGRGKVNGVKAGETVIRVSDGSGMSTACRVTVSPATLIFRKSALSVVQGKRASISWSIKPSGSKKVAISWSSLDPAVATVDEKGRVTGVYPGTTTITGTMPSGQAASLTVTIKPVAVRSVSIKPSSLKMTLGDTASVTARISPSGATWPDVTWSSGDERIVGIDQSGRVTANGVGKTTITATTREGKSRTIKVTVNPVYVKKIVLSDVPTGLIGGVKGKNQAQLTYSIQPAGATIQDVVWSSSNRKILTVDENGVITAHAAGKAYVTCKATDGSGRSTRVRVTVNKNELNRPRPASVNGQLVVCAQTMRYTSKSLEVKMYFSNRTGARVSIPEGGTLTVVTPDGTRIPALKIESRRYRLNNRATRTETYRIPLTAQLVGLDLSKCDALILP